MECRILMDQIWNGNAGVLFNESRRQHLRPWSLNVVDNEGPLYAMSWDGSNPFHTKGDDINAAVILVEGLLYVHIVFSEKRNGAKADR